MPFVVDPALSNPRILIPIDLPDIMKQYTKAAIRTQPRDVLQWSVAYFQAVACGERPPVKERIEFVSKANSWISLGFLRVLHRQLGNIKGVVPTIQIQNNWKGLCLDELKFYEVIRRGCFGENVEWLSFLAVACCLVYENLIEALTLFCEVVTEEPEGCPAWVDYRQLSHACLSMMEFYGVVDRNVVETFLQHLEDCAQAQDNKVHPGNFRTPACPKIG